MDSTSVGGPTATPSAIETHYNGYRFSSRLEARWACFLDALGVKYEYEPAGFDLGEAGLYLPDFYLPEQDWYMEVKGTTEAALAVEGKLRAFAQHWRLAVFVGNAMDPEHDWRRRDFEKVVPAFADHWATALAPEDLGPGGVYPAFLWGFCLGGCHFNIGFHGLPSAVSRNPFAGVCTCVANDERMLAANARYAAAYEAFCRTYADGTPWGGG